MEGANKFSSEKMGFAQYDCRLMKRVYVSRILKWPRFSFLVVHKTHADELRREVKIGLMRKNTSSLWGRVEFNLMLDVCKPRVSFLRLFDVRRCIRTDLRNQRQENQLYYTYSTVRCSGFQISSDNVTSVIASRYWHICKPRTRFSLYRTQQIDFKSVIFKENLNLLPYRPSAKKI